jgi:hypothetical protein
MSLGTSSICLSVMTGNLPNTKTRARKEGRETEEESHSDEII